MNIKAGNTLFLVLMTTLTSCGKKAMQQEKITPQALSQWETLDKGKSTIQGDALIIEEIEGSDGYFLISPKSYKKDFTLRYKVKALSASSVLITLFSVSQQDQESKLSLPSQYSSPEEFWKWRSNMQHYNLTINNRSHGNTPFFFKNLSPHFRGFYKNLPDNIMETDQWYDVEIGKKGTHIWFKLNDNIVFNAEDCTPLNGGHLIFRISGTTGDKTIFAKAALKDIVISYEE